MNFLAHIYLSGESEKHKIGNFIGDFVKGKEYEKYPEEIKNGIIHHRKIDSFTDKHSLYLEAKEIFKPLYKKYAGIIVDIVYDHFLAKNWDTYHHTSLLKFSRAFYFSLVKNYAVLPSRVKYFLPFMIQSNRLNSYADLEGIQRVFQIMENNTSLPDYSSEAIDVIKNNYDFLEKNFTSFFQIICNSLYFK